MVASHKTVESSVVLMSNDKYFVSMKKEYYTKMRWFFTKSGKLVYGGKSAEQNDKVVLDLLKNKKNRMVMHTKIPGSPFAVIDDYIGSVTVEDMKEVAVWTACFSRAWRSGLKRTTIDVFLSEQLYKSKSMSVGTFGVMGEIDKINVELKLVLCNQDKVLRAVPEASVKGNKLGVIVPGKIDKEKFAEELSKKLKKSKDEILNALPTGGFGLGK